MRRRRFLSVAGTAGTLGLAGCLGGSRSEPGQADGGDGGSSTQSPGDDGGGGDGDGSDGEDGDDGGQSIDSHPAAADLADQPRKGELGGNVILAFEDPSCSRCRAFERNTVPEIESKLVEPGKAAFVFRGYPVVYPWGEPATHVLEATFDRSEAAFWSLLGHYFDEQSAFSTDNVLGRSREFLADETDLDAAAVIGDVEDDAYDAAVQADLDAGRDADLGGITPAVVLFRDGEYVTEATGSVSYELIATALGEG